MLKEMTNANNQQKILFTEKNHNLYLYQGYYIMLVKKLNRMDFNKYMYLNI